MLRRNGYLMRGYVEAGEGNDLLSVEWPKWRMPYHQLVWPTEVGAQEAEAPGKMCCDRLKSVNWVVMAN